MKITDYDSVLKNFKKNLDILSKKTERKNKIVNLLLLLN
jgi:hypothetical protein